MTSKRSKAEIIRLVEAAIEDVGGTPKLNVMVRDVKVSGSPPEKIIAKVIVRFLKDAGPYCCGEPTCYSNAFTTNGEIEIGDFLRSNFKPKSTMRQELNSQRFDLSTVIRRT